jgi:hypothetical protein
MNDDERLQKLEDQVSRMAEQLEIMTIDKESLINRISELEDDHISLLLHLCVCNNDGGDNGSCESIMHYCICAKLKERTYDCRAKNFINDGVYSGHKCICPYEVKNGIEGLTRVKWCNAHSELVDVSLDIDEPIIQTVYNVMKNYNPRRFMKHFIARIKK